MSEDTLLRITGVSFPEGSARNVQANLTVEDRGERYRTVNQVARNAVNPDWIDKFLLQANVNDINVPTLDSLQIGDIVEVEPINNISAQIPAGDTTVILDREPVAGSDFAETITGDSVSVTTSEATAGVWESVISVQTEDVAVFYRPKLTMIVDNILRSDFAEWDGTISWSLSFLEV